MPFNYFPRYQHFKPYLYLKVMITNIVIKLNCKVYILVRKEQSLSSEFNGAAILFYSDAGSCNQA